MQDDIVAGWRHTSTRLLARSFSRDLARASGLLRSRGRYPEAVEAYWQAIRLKPDYGDAHFNLALNYFRMGEKDSAFNECQILKNRNHSGANELFKLVSQ